MKKDNGPGRRDAFMWCSLPIHCLARRGGLAWPVRAARPGILWRQLMSSFHKIALFGVTGATLAVSTLVVGSAVATASSGFSVGSVTSANPRAGVHNLS